VGIIIFEGGTDMDFDVMVGDGTECGVDGPRTIVTPGEGERLVVWHGEYRRVRFVTGAGRFYCVERQGRILAVRLDDCGVVIEDVLTRTELPGAWAAAYGEREEVPR
jgi:hypothetical protein